MSLLPKSKKELGEGQHLINTPQLTKGIIAIDNGGRYIKIAKKDWVLPNPIPSRKVFAFKRNVGAESDGEYDFVIRWKNKTFFTGNIAIRESTALKVEAFTESKAKDYFILSILQSIHMYGYDINYVVTCVPIIHHIKEEKERIRQLLIGTHTLTINEVEKTFEIKEVLVMAECINAFWAIQPLGKTRWLDIGSRTVNFGTMEVIDGVVYPIAGESHTLQVGLEKTDFETFVDFANGIEGQLGQYGWSNEDEIYLIGGGAEHHPALVEAMIELYPKITVPENPQNLQVQGMYVFGEDEFLLEE